MKIELRDLTQKQIETALFIKTNDCKELFCDNCPYREVYCNTLYKHDIKINEQDKTIIITYKE